MTGPILHSMPRLRDVLREQVRVVGFALRWPAVLAGVALSVLTVIITTDVIAQGKIIDFHPEQFLLPALLALLLPIAVWYREDRFGNGFLWTLPVDRRSHALSRVVAGWIWLMAAIACIVLLLLILSLASGENIVATETLRLLPEGRDPAPGSFDLATLQTFPTVQWTPQPLLWLVPFTAATCVYLFASALALGTRHPFRWIIGTLLLLFLVMSAGEAAEVGWILSLPDRVLRPLLLAPYGLDTVLTARTEVLKVGTILVSGESTDVWRAVPDLGEWAIATLLWTGAALAALWAAAFRHRERRRG